MSAAARDICVQLPNQPGALAQFGETLGRAGVSLNGGGVFTHEGVGIAHFLVDDADTAVTALAAAGLPVMAVSDVVMLRLDQETPGQLGTLTRLMAEAGVNIDTQYSDHDHNLILIVPPGQLPAARAVATSWTTATPLLGSPKPGAKLP